MTDDMIPESLRAWAASDADADTKLNSVMQLYGEALDSGRCILYSRQPESGRVNTTHAWWSDEKYAIDWPSWVTDEWVDEGPPNEEDPLYHAALTRPDVIVYIDDIDNDPTGLVNSEFEHRVFHHQALIHAPVHYDDKFYGILEPSVFGAPRDWTPEQRAITAWTVKQIGPLVAEYVALHGPKETPA